MRIGSGKKTNSTVDNGRNIVDNFYPAVTREKKYEELRNKQLNEFRDTRRQKANKEYQSFALKRYIAFIAVPFIIAVLIRFNFKAISHFIHGFF